MSRARSIPAERHAVGLLLALALVVRLLVPTGWMPEIDANGIRLTWCGSAGPPPPAFMAAMADTAERLSPHGGLLEPDHSGNQHGDQEKSGGDQLCAYAGLAFAAVEPVIGTLDGPIDVYDPALPPAMVATVGRGLAAPPPPSTGPPHLI